MDFQGTSGSRPNYVGEDLADELDFDTLEALLVFSDHAEIPRSHLARLSDVGGD